jgi:hypothetical protein
MVASYLAPHYPPAPAWLGYTFIFFRPLTYLGAAAVVTGLLIAATVGTKPQLDL